MALCCFAEKDGEILCGAEDYVKYELLNNSVTQQEIKADILCRLSEDISVKENYTINKSGVNITISGYENIGFMLPVFDFDGEKNSRITINENNIIVEYEGNICRYEFEGRLDLNYKSYYNRNGRYRVFKILKAVAHLCILRKSVEKQKYKLYNYSCPIVVLWAVNCLEEFLCTKRRYQAYIVNLKLMVTVIVLHI